MILHRAEKRALGLSDIRRDVQLPLFLNECQW